MFNRGLFICLITYFIIIQLVKGFTFPLGFRTIASNVKYSNWKMSTLMRASESNFEKGEESNSESKHDSERSNSEPVLSDGEKTGEHPNSTKLHTQTVCMVPPALYTNVWEAITKARTELRDPGLFRWPPHANILYPFYDVKPKTEKEFDMDVIDKLGLAVKSIEPFEVCLDSFGTFGGSNRGVLFLYPRSFRGVDPKSYETESEEIEEESLIELQSVLQDHLPECNDQKKNGKYTPHITLSHFKNLEDALEGKEKIEKWWEPLSFIVNEIYLLKRVGDDGQFKMLATLPLGKDGADIILHDPCIVFPDMPLEEEDWVREERMALKARRNGKGRWGKRKSRRRKKKGPVDRGPSKSRDTPEEIARKRAERAAKRERLAKEVAAIEAAAIEAAILGTNMNEKES